MRLCQNKYEVSDAGIANGYGADGSNSPPFLYLSPTEFTQDIYTILFLFRTFIEPFKTKFSP